MAGRCALTTRGEIPYAPVLACHNSPDLLPPFQGVTLDTLDQLTVVAKEAEYLGEIGSGSYLDHPFGQLCSADLGYHIGERIMVGSSL